MSGWYRLHRGWQDHAVFRREPYSRRDAFVWLIENACYEPGEVRLASGTIALQRGQLAHSLRFMAKAWIWDEAKVRRFLASLRQAKIIDACADAGQTVVTICNYAKYQDQRRDVDAAADARTTQPRRGGDAKKKEGEEGKKNGRTRPGENGYAFEGKTVRLTAADFDDWRRTFHTIADLQAELSSIDSWFDQQPGDERRTWFHRTKRMLNGKHQQNLARRDPQPGGGVISSIDDSFMRRLARFEAGRANGVAPEQRPGREQVS